MPPTNQILIQLTEARVDIRHLVERMGEYINRQQLVDTRQDAYMASHLATCDRHMEDFEKRISTVEDWVKSANLVRVMIGILTGAAGGFAFFILPLLLKIFHIIQ